MRFIVCEEYRLNYRQYNRRITYGILDTKRMLYVSMISDSKKDCEYSAALLNRKKNYKTTRWWIPVSVKDMVIYYRTGKMHR